MFIQILSQVNKIILSYNEIFFFLQALETFYHFIVIINVINLFNFESLVSLR